MVYVYIFSCFGGIKFFCLCDSRYYIGKFRNYFRSMLTEFFRFFLTPIFDFKRLPVFVHPDHEEFLISLKFVCSYPGFRGRLGSVFIVQRARHHVGCGWRAWGEGVKIFLGDSPQSLLKIFRLTPLPQRILAADVWLYTLPRAFVSAVRTVCPCTRCTSKIGGHTILGGEGWRIFW